MTDIFTSRVILGLLQCVCIISSSAMCIQGKVDLAILAGLYAILLEMRLQDEK
jgi:hypothetical protein